MAKAKKPRKTTKATYKADPNRRRLQVICTPEQEDALTKAASDSGAKDRSSWILSAALAAAASDGAITIAQPLAGQLADHARAIGQAPDELIRAWLAGSLATHGGAAA